MIKKSLLALGLLLVIGGCRTQMFTDDFGHFHDDDGDFSEVAAKGGLAEKCVRFDNGMLDGDDLLVLVNKQPENQLKSSYVPRDLVRIDKKYMAPNFSRARMRTEAASKFVEMMEAARGEGHYLFVRTAFRGFSHQCHLFLKKLKKKPENYVRKISAEPGRSQHQLGTTADISVESRKYALRYTIDKTPEIKWLLANSYQFGWVLSYPRPRDDQIVQGERSDYNPVTGYLYEPWHYRYIGVKNALEMKSMGMILEEYLQFKTQELGRQ